MVETLETNYPSNGQIKMMTVILTSDQIVARLIQLLANQTTPTFVSVPNYTNAEGEVANHVFNIGASYGKAKDADTIALGDSKILEGIDFGSVAMYAEQARIALLEANKKVSNQSIGQQDAYFSPCANVRVHIATGRVFVFGLRVSKKVLVEGTYKSVNSAPLTIAKDKIRKVLKATKFRQFAFDQITGINLKGEELVFDLA